MSKICIIGLDGGTFTVIDYLVAQGRLPNFARLMDQGSRATLFSTVPPITWPAWASFYTGANPGKTGAADIFKFRPGTYQLEPMNAGNLRGTPFWSLAGSGGKRVCIYNVPVTYPAIPVNGVMVSGLDAPEFNDRAVYPVEFKSSLLEAIPDFQISFENDARYLVNHHPDPVGEWIRQSRRYLEMEIRTIDYLMGLEDWDLFVAVVRSTDIFQHTHWRAAEEVIAGVEVSAEDMVRAEAVFACYEAVDHQLGGAWSDFCKDRSLMIMSDHGFGRLHGYVSVNRVLADAALLKFRMDRPTRSPRTFLTDKLKSRLPKATRQKLKLFLGRGKLPDRWLSYTDSLVADIDWTQTRLCSIGGFGCLFVNLKGRDPLGTVASEAERQQVLAEAEAALSELKDPRDGLPLISRFYRKEELYDGPLMAEMPDMVIDIRDWSYCPVIGTANDLAVEGIIRPLVREWKQLAHTGAHRREGILLLHGPGIKNADLGAAEMVDLAPTIMNLLGLPPMDGWDGRILEEAFINGASVTSPPGKAYASASGDDRKPVYSEEDEEEIRKRLENLGYL